MKPAVATFLSKRENQEEKEFKALMAERKAERKEFFEHQWELRERALMNDDYEGYREAEAWLSVEFDDDDDDEDF
jgi:hypothetical protein